MVDDKEAALGEAAEALGRLQATLSARVQVSGAGLWAPAPGALALSLDIQYEGERAHVAGDLSRLGEEGSLGTWAGVVEASFPYVPGFFCFREGPPLLALVERLRLDGLCSPEVLVIDGHGVAHPRRFGVACWMGLATGLPAVGCAKESLVRFDAAPGPARGHWSPVLVEGALAGAALRTQPGVKPVFVSAGHRLDLDAALAVTLGLGGEYRVPEALRRADHVARARSRGEAASGWTELGALAPVAAPWEQEG